MKKTLLTALALGCVSSMMLAGSAMALTTDVTVTYTGDNIVDTWYIQGETGTPANIGATTNRAAWTLADTQTVNLEIGEEFAFVWEVSNVNAGSLSNPAGFLAEIDFGGADPLYSNLTWDYAIKDSDDSNTTGDFTTWTWCDVTEWAYNDGSVVNTIADADGNGKSIWYDGNGGSIADISGDAAWIWSENNFSSEMDQELFIRAQVTPVPEPATMLLFGTGLAGLVGVSRRRKKQA